MENRFVMRFARPEHVRFVSQNEWAFEPRKRWAWLHKAAWWFLRKTVGVSNAIKDRVDYKEVVIDRNRVADQICRAMDEMHIQHIRPGEVFMGPDMFDAAMMELRSSYEFQVEMGYNRTMFGLPVTVVPWMRGVLVVPERR
jgi:hypothetical protein